MNQLTFSDMEYFNRKKKTRREEFLDAMEEIIPWKYWVDMIRPQYFNNQCGRKPIGIETMLRMYLMQIWFNLSDEGIEDSIYDSYAMRSFMHIDFNEKQVPDTTTLLKFRHMLESNKLGEKIFADVNNRLDKAGLIMHGGTIVDASLIETANLIREDDEVVYGDSGYLGAVNQSAIKKQISGSSRQGTPTYVPPHKGNELIPEQYRTGTGFKDTRSCINPDYKDLCQAFS